MEKLENFVKEKNRLLFVLSALGGALLFLYRNIKNPLNSEKHRLKILEILENPSKPFYVLPKCKIYDDIILNEIQSHWSMSKWTIIQGSKGIGKTIVGKEIAWGILRHFPMNIALGNPIIPVHLCISKFEKNEDNAKKLFHLIEETIKSLDGKRLLLIVDNAQLLLNKEYFNQDKLRGAFDTTFHNFWINNSLSLILIASQQENDESNFAELLEKAFTPKAFGLFILYDFNDVLVEKKCELEKYFESTCNSLSLPKNLSLYMEDGFLKLRLLCNKLMKKLVNKYKD